MAVAAVENAKKEEKAVAVEMILVLMETNAEEILKAAGSDAEKANQTKKKIKDRFLANAEEETDNF